MIGLTGTYGDVINTVLIYTLRITTNMQSVTFGHVTGPLNFSLTPPAGGQIVGLFGRSGARIDALGVIASAAGTMASDFESVWNSVLLVRTPAVDRTRYRSRCRSERRI